jgi:hypothetical protein
VVAAIFGDKIGMTPDKIWMLGGLCAVLVMAISGEDISEKLQIKLPDDKEAAKKENLIVDVIKALKDGEKDKKEIES